MTKEIRSLPTPPSVVFDYRGAVEHTLPSLEADRLPWVFQAFPYVDDADERIFAAFGAIDLKAKGVWLIRGLLARAPEGGHVGVRQLVIDPYDDGAALPEIRSTDVRVRVGAIRDRALGLLETQGKIAQATPAFFQSVPGGSEPFVEAARRVGNGAKKPGRPSHPDEYYQWVALTYLELFRGGVGRGILGELADLAAERLGRPVPKQTVREWVHRARELGFLTKGRQGRAGASPGPRLQTREENDD